MLDTSYFTCERFTGPCTTLPGASVLRCKSTRLAQFVEEWPGAANGGARCAESAHGLHVGEETWVGAEARQLHLFHFR